MWTYLIFFLGVSALIGVFVRRAILLKLKKKVLFVPKLTDYEKEGREKDGEEEAKLSKSGKVKIESLLVQADDLLKKGHEDEAIKVLVQALVIHDKHVETQQKLAMLYLQKQMFGAAAALFKQLSDITKDPIHYSHLGFALFQQSALDEAKEAYQKAVDIDPSRPQRFISLAQVYRAANQLQNAIIAVNKALELDPNNVEFLLLLAAMQSEMGNVSEAKNALKIVLEKNPGNQEAILLLKRLDKEIGEG